MSKKHNRRNKQPKGPQLSEGERLWKRMSVAIGDNQELWEKSWDAQSIAELVIGAENERKLAEAERIRSEDAMKHMEKLEQMKHEHDAYIKKKQQEAQGSGASKTG